MTAFPEIFENTANFLRGKGIFPEVEMGSPASPDDVEHFEDENKLVFPDAFSSFYTGFANGFNFKWEADDKGRGYFAMPDLVQLNSDYQQWLRNVRDFSDDRHSMDRCVKPKFREQAFVIWRRMESWIPFWDEGNGDRFCLDTKTGQVVYHQHDWFDGFGSFVKTNGILAGDDLLSFVQNWSRFCFQGNKAHWWGEFNKFGAIQWNPEYFDGDFFTASK